jgi:hypothetical protein
VRRTSVLELIPASGTCTVGQWDEFWFVILDLGCHEPTKTGALVLLTRTGATAHGLAAHHAPARSSGRARTTSTRARARRTTGRARTTGTKQTARATGTTSQSASTHTAATHTAATEAGTEAGAGTKSQGRSTRGRSATQHPGRQTRVRGTAIASRTSHAAGTEPATAARITRQGAHRTVIDRRSVIRGRRREGPADTRR